MKILTTFYQLNYLENLSMYVDGFLIGNDSFGTRLTHSFDSDEIIEALIMIEKLNKELFLMANQMFTDSQLDDFEKWILKLPIEKFQGIIVTDLGALHILEKLGYQNKVIYHPETLLTNAYDFNFLATNNIQGAFVAKEITLSDVIAIGRQKKYKMFMVGHGHLNMFYSKRQLIDNFMVFTESENPYHNKQNMRLIEETRKEEPYPIFEDQAGTHVFRSQVSTSLKHLEELDYVVDYLMIDTLFKDDHYAQSVLNLYHHRLYDKHLIEKIKTDYQEVWDEGFFYKKTVYKQKG